MIPCVELGGRSEGHDEVDSKPAPFEKPTAKGCATRLKLALDVAVSSFGLFTV